MDENRESGDNSAEFVKRLTEAQFALQSYIAFLIGNVEDAKDILQETNLSLWRQARKYDYSRPFLPWAKSIAMYKVMTYRTLQSRERLVFDNELLAQVAVVADKECDSHRMLSALEECVKLLTTS